MKNYQGLVLLLEEDYYVTPDVVTILQMMNNLRDKYVLYHMSPDMTKLFFWVSNQVQHNKDCAATENG